MVVTALKAFWAKSGKRGRVALLLAALALFNALRSSSRRRAFSWDGKTFADPTFGRTIPEMVYDPHNAQPEETTWEVFLRSLKLDAASPLTGHIRNLFARPGMDNMLRRLFVQLVGSEEDICVASHVALLSRGLSGSIRCFAAEPKRAESVPLAECTQEDTQWIQEGFSMVYNKDQPLNIAKFPAFVRLIIVRRILRTLIACFGLESLEQSISAPLVIDITINIGSDEEFRIHTVAPKCSTYTGDHSLAVLQEDEEDEEEDQIQATSSVRNVEVTPRASFGRSLSLRDEEELSKVDAAFRDVSRSRILT